MFSDRNRIQWSEAGTHQVCAEVMECCGSIAISIHIRYEKALKDAKRTGVYKAVFTAASMGILFFIFMSMYAVGLW